MSDSPSMRSAGPSIEIVRAGLEDVDTIAPMFDAYRVFYKQPANIAGARAFLLDGLRQGASVVFVAHVKRGGTTDAAGFTQLFPTLSSVSMGRVWILNDLFVSERHRGVGAGRALMLHATEFARSTGAVRITLATAIDNTTAKSLYESLGWLRNDRYDHYSLTL